MDKSYIIRIYKQKNKVVSGVMEDIEKNQRFCFSSANELWSLITRNMNEQPIGTLIEPSIFKTINK